MQSQASKQLPHDDRRESVRYAAQLQVRFGVHGLDRRAPVANVSEGGMCIKTNDVYKTGTLVHVALDLPGGEIHLRAEVMWAIGVPEHQTEYMEHGMGLQFLDAGSEWRKAFARWKSESL